MPDIYEYNDFDEYTGQEIYQVFWYEGEFYLCDKTWGPEKTLDIPKRQCEYYDTTDEVLAAMLKIAPYKDWKKVDSL